MCKILTPNTWELINFHAKLIFSIESAETYAQRILWKKAILSLGSNINKYIDDLNLILLSVWIEEDELEVGFLEQAIECFFLYGFCSDKTMENKRQAIEDKFHELFREELINFSLSFDNQKTRKLLQEY